MSISFKRPPHRTVLLALALALHTRNVEDECYRAAVKLRPLWLAFSCAFKIHNPSFLLQPLPPLLDER